MKQVSKASQLNKSVKQVSLASQVKQVGLASQVSNLPKSSQESEIKKVLVKQVQVKQVKSSKFKLSNLNQASEVMLDRDTAPRKRPSTRLSGKKLLILQLPSLSVCESVCFNPFVQNHRISDPIVQAAIFGDKLLTSTKEHCFFGYCYSNICNIMVGGFNPSEKY